MTLAAFVDLDGTLIFSRRAVQEWDAADCDAEEYRSVDFLEGEPRAWISSRTAELLERLQRQTAMIPATARSVAQYQRLMLFSRPSENAITTNGGTILVNGAPHPEWEEHVARLWGNQCAHPSEIADALRGHRSLVRDGRLVVVTSPDAYGAVESEAALRDLVDGLGWRVERDGRRTYLTPGPLSKMQAASWLLGRMDASRWAAVGDSMLDLSLLLAADVGFVPAHGELARVTILPPHIRRTTRFGSQAAEQVCEWILELSESDLAAPRRRFHHARAH